MKTSITASSDRTHTTTGASISKERSVHLETARPGFTLMDLRRCPSLPSRAPMSQLTRDSLPSIPAIRDLRAIMRTFYGE